MEKHLVLVSLVYLLVVVNAHAIDMRPLDCKGGQKVKVEAPTNLSGQSFDVRCDSRHPDSISFIYTPADSKESVVVSILKTDQMKNSFLMKMLAERTIKDIVTKATESNTAKLPRPNAVGKDSNNRLVGVFSSNNSIIEIHDGRKGSSEKELVAFAKGFAEAVGPIVSSWKE